MIIVAQNTFNIRSCFSWTFGNMISSALDASLLLEAEVFYVAVTHLEHYDTSDFV